MPDRKIVILGGGLCGLTIAHKLHEAKYDVKLFEKLDNVAGTAKTINVGGQGVDLTGHALHLNNDSVKRYIFEELMLGNELDMVNRNAAVYFQDRLVPYPFQYNLSCVDENMRNKCVIDYLRAYYKSNRKSKEEISFYEYCMKYFGEGISNSFMLPYNSKLWATQPSRMTTRWMGEFVPLPNKNKILKGAFVTEQSGHYGYNQKFYYPINGGIQILADTIYNQCTDVVHLNSEVMKVDLEDKKIWVNGKSAKYDLLISTIPLYDFLQVCGLRKKSHFLRWTTTRAYFFLIDQQYSMNYTWLYIPEKKFGFYRLGNFNYFNKCGALQKEHVLWAECSKSSKSKTCFPKQNEIINELAQIKMEGVDLSKVKFLGSYDINPSYAVYDFNWENKHRLLEELKTKGVIMAGRYGSWEYLSMENVINNGLKVVQSIITN